MSNLSKLDRNDAVIRDFGVNSKGEISVITEDMEAAQAFCKDIEEMNYSDPRVRSFLYQRL